MKLRGIFVLLLAFVSVAALVQAQDARIAEQQLNRGIVQLWDRLLPLTSVTSFMTVGAHPDDERSSVLSLLSRGYGVRTITVTANRGEGGQNAIGTDYRQALGVLRSREMEEAALAFDVELFFLSESFDDPIYDESFSKSAVETLELWGEDVLMEKLVRAIRQSRPDVLFTNFQNVFGQHGHHRAMAAAAQEAFRLAGDPNAFPEHMAMGLEPWQPLKFYLPAGTGGSREEEPTELPATLTLPVGEYDQIYGASYLQVSEQSRAYHLSQGMGNFRPEGPSESELHLADSVVDVPASETDIFAGIPRTVADLADGLEDEDVAARLLELDAALAATVDAFPEFEVVADNAALALSLTRSTREAVAASDLPDAVKYDLDFRLAHEESELQYAAQSALSLVPRLALESTELTPGSTTRATLTAFVGGETPVEDVTLDLVAPEGWTVERVLEEGETADPVALGYNETATATFQISVPEDAEPYNPYRRNVSPTGANGLVYGVVGFAIAGQEMSVEVDDDRIVAVLPQVSIATTPEYLVHNTLSPDAPIEVSAVLTNYAAAGSTVVGLELPAGWSSEPPSAEVTFAETGETASVTFTVVPPEGVANGTYEIGVSAQGELSSSENVDVIEYDHIGRTYLVTPAVVDLAVLDVEFDPELRIGYVDGGSDLVYEGLRRIGLDVTLLSDEFLASGDFDEFDTIVVGIYGYAARPALAAANARLLEWVEDGGNLLVQYHRPSDNWDPESTPPFPIALGRVSLLSRVTDQNAPVEILEPDHALMTTPNQITSADFDGWIKERGLYFAQEWSEEYTPLFSITDTQWPDTAQETPFTGPMLTAEVGEGRYTYTSLALHTQIEVNVPGAYRLYANLVTPR